MSDHRLLAGYEGGRRDIDQSHISFSFYSSFDGVLSSQTCTRIWGFRFMRPAHTSEMFEVRSLAPCII